MPVDGDVILKAGLDTSDISKKVDGIQKTINKGLKNIIRVGFGVRSIYALIRKLRSALFSGFGDLSKVYEPFNSAMSQIMTSLNLLRNTFASAFAPIIETVAPALSTFINMIAEAVSKVGQFIAALTGKEYVQAGTAYIDYAQSLDKSSKSSANATKQTQKQTEAQKKLNREITHFDDLVILHDKEKEDTTETPTSTPTSTSTFTPMPVGDAVSQFAKDFKAAWAKADFTDIGRQIGEKLNGALENIPWAKIQATTRKIAKSIATFLNGFIETPGLFTNIGKTVGQAINTALAGLSTFAWNFHWGSLGTAVGDAVKAALDIINWDDAFSAAEGFGRGIASYLNNLLATPGLFTSIGTTVGNAVNTALVGLSTFAWSFNWDSLGKAVGDTVTSALDTINWEGENGVYSAVNGFASGLADFLNRLLQTPKLFDKIGKTVGKLINATLQGLNTFAWSFNWGSLGTAIKTTIISALYTINWKTVYSTVSGFASGLATFLNNLFTDDTFSAVGATAAQLINNAFHFLAVFGVTFKWSQFGNSLAMGLNKFLAKLDINEFGSGIRSFVIGIRDGIVSFLSTVNWYKFGTTLRDIIEAIPWTTILTSFGQVFWNIINSVITAAKGFFKTDVVGGPVAEAFDKLQTTLKGIVDSIDFDKIADGFTRIVNALKPAVEGIFIGMVGFFNRLYEIGQRFLQALGPALQDIATALESIDPDILRGVGTALGLVAGALVTINLAKNAIGVITGLFSPLTGLASSARDAATALGSGSLAAGGTGLVGALFMAASGVGAFLIALEYGKETIATDEKEWEGYGKVVGGISTELKTVAEDLKLNDTQLAQVSDTLAQAHNPVVTNAKELYDNLEKSLESSGVDVEAFRQGIAKVAAESNDAVVVQQLSKYIDTVGVSASDAETDTSDFGKSFDVFNKLSIATPIKLLLLKTAISGLGDSGKLSENKVADLQTELDKINPKNPKASFDKIKKAMDDGSISADEFTASIASAMMKAPPQVQKDLNATVQKFKDANGNFQTAGKENINNVVAGMQLGAQESSATTTQVGKDVVSTVFNGMDTEAESHSPSKKAEQRGIWIGDGLKIGMESMQNTLVTTAGTIIRNVVTKIDEYKSSMNTSGSALGTELDNGIGSKESTINKTGDSLGSSLDRGINSNASTINRTGSSLVLELDDGLSSKESTINRTGDNLGSELISGVDSNSSGMNRMGSSLGSELDDGIKSRSWYDLGDYIGTGIYNGLIANSSSLNTLAYNTAYDMYQNACDALDVASPSKKFAWIGKMVAQGLGNGITDNEDNAVDAVTGMTDALTEEAEKTNPAISISTSIDSWINSLDDVLTDFSETIINRFDSLINTLVQLSNVSTVIPAIAQGKVIPSSVTTASSASTTNSEIKSMLESLASRQLDYDDLRSLLIEMFTDYMRTDFYLGDEQIARHANNGNLLLNRRYSIMKS